MEKLEVAQLFGGKCEGCQKIVEKKFTFHHLRYVEGEKTHGDFANSKEYNQYILPKIVRDRNRFVLLCNNCHNIIDAVFGGRGLSRMPYTKLIRLLNIALLTHHEHRRTNKKSARDRTRSSKSKARRVYVYRQPTRTIQAAKI